MGVTDRPDGFEDVPEPFRERWRSQTQLILGSYFRLFGRALIPPGENALADARALYAAPFAVLSHDTRPDPLLNYANRTALTLWEATIPGLTATPSRLTAEPIAQEARQRLMAEVERTGFVTGYAGTRISATGKRFRIENVTIWNLTAEDGTFAGQAASFDRWSP